MANGKTSQAAVGSSPGPDQPFFLPLLHNLQLFLQNNSQKTFANVFTCFYPQEQLKDRPKMAKKWAKKRAKNGQNACKMTVKMNKRPKSITLENSKSLKSNWNYK